MRMRLTRSALSVPASERRKTEKAAASGADIVFLDLEDSVGPNEKVAARENVVWAVRELDWGNTSIAYRVNGLDTPLFYRDVIDVVERVGDRLDAIVVPKGSGTTDITTTDTLLRQIELAIGTAPGRIRIQAIVESASGLLAVEAIASTATRLEALIFGPGDFAASVGMPSSGIGEIDEWDSLYPGHRFHYPMSRIVIAARSCNLGAIDGPMANFRDLDAFRTSCLIARSLGYNGKWCIHPAQLAVAHEIFTPTADEVESAGAVVNAYEEAARSGTGVIAIDGRMIDAASVTMAQATLDLAREVGLV